MAGVFLKNGLPGWSGLEAGFHRLEAGHETILHRHNFYELEIVTRGCGLHRIHGRALPFSAGECWLIGGIDSHGRLFLRLTRHTVWHVGRNHL